MKREKIIEKLNYLKKSANDENSALYDAILDYINTHTKKYGLVWEKEIEQEKIVEDCLSNIPILKIDESKTINNGGASNLLIEGDNYHSMLALNMLARESVDIIYIDPPYNTGLNDFIYDDDFINNDDGFKHSKWIILSSSQRIQEHIPNTLPLRIYSSSLAIFHRTRITFITNSLHNTSLFNELNISFT